MLAVFKEEWGMAGGTVNLVVVSKFGGGKPVRPIILHEVSVELKVLFKFLIGLFGHLSVDEKLWRELFGCRVTC